MSFCSKCGANLKDGDTFCHNCGNRVEHQKTFIYPAKIEKDDTLLKVLTILAIIFMPYVAFFILIFKKPFKKNTNIGWAVYCILFSIFLFSMIINLQKNDNDIINAKSITSTVKELPKDTLVSIGETISTNSFEITIKSIELSYDVLPTTKNTFYTHYAADSGKVYIDISFDVKNIQKQNISCDNVISVKAEYDNEYTYSGFIVVEDDNLGFTYSMISSIDPLETKSMRYLIDCPQEVEETNNPLILIFTIGNKTYKYVIR